MRLRQVLTILAVAVAILSANSARAEHYVESWNDADLEANKWRQYIENDPWDVQSGWESSGGYDASGRIDSVLENLRLNPRFKAFYPAWVSSHDGDANGRKVDFRGMTVSVRVNEPGGIDLKDGSLYFYVGEYQDEDNHGWFTHNAPIAIGSGSWNDPSEINIVGSGNAANWTANEQAGTTTLTDLLVEPQQFGFIIAKQGGYLDADKLSGTLMFDDFSVTPEPSTLAGLAGMAAVGLIIAWRKRRRGPVAG